MVVWLVHTYRNGQYLGLAVTWAFASKEAADFWIENRADHTSNWRYVPEMMPGYNLDQVKSFTA